MSRRRHHHLTRPSLPNLHDLSTTSQEYKLVIVTDGTNTVAEITAAGPDGENRRVGYGTSRRHKTDARDRQTGELLAAQRAFQSAANEYGDMLAASQEGEQFAKITAEVIGRARKEIAQGNKARKRKHARERFEHQNGGPFRLGGDNPAKGE